MTACSWLPRLGLRLLFFVEGVCGFLFCTHSDGLIFYCGESQLYMPVQELMSSGSDDNVAFGLIGLLGLAGASSLTILDWMGSSYFRLTAVLFCLPQSMCLLLPEVGSIYDTLLVRHNIFLLLILLSQGAIVLTVWRHQLPNFQAPTESALRPIQSGQRRGP